MRILTKIKKFVFTESVGNINLILEIDHIERYNPAVQKLKQFLDEGRLGELERIITYRLGKYPYRIIDIGVIEDLVIHDLDVSRFLIGRNIKGRITQKTEESFWRSNQVDYSQIVVEFENGVKCFLNTNWLIDKKLRYMVVKGSDAIATVDFIEQKLRVCMPSMVKKIRHGSYEEFKKIEKKTNEIFKEIRVKKEEPLKLSIKDFIKCCKTRKKPLSDGKNGLENLKILLKN